MSGAHVGARRENAGMLSPPPSNSERVQSMAASLGCTVGVYAPPSGPAHPALLGSAASFSATLVEFGARFDPQEKIYLFSNWPTLEAALRHVLDQRQAAR